MDATIISELAVTPFSISSVGTLDTYDPYPIPEWATYLAFEYTTFIPIFAPIVLTVIALFMVFYLRRSGNQLRRGYQMLYLLLAVLSLVSIVAGMWSSDAAHFAFGREANGSLGTTSSVPRLYFVLLGDTFLAVASIVFTIRHCLKLKRENFSPSAMRQGWWVLFGIFVLLILLIITQLLVPRSVFHGGGPPRFRY